MGRGKKQGRSSWVPRANDHRDAILKLGAEGVSPDVIASALNLDVAHVKHVLDASGSAQENAASSQAANDDAIVKRLMKDPEELCCPLSYELMEDPVVAADGITYEREMVEECFARMPHKSPMTGLPISTTVLNPIQQTKSLIVSFKEETVKEILAVVPRLGRQHALELLERGEGFVRPLLPDASARKKLASLLFLRLKLPGTDHDVIAKEAVSLLLALQDEAFLREAFLDMKDSDLVAFLPSLDEESVSKLHRAMSSWNAPGKWLVDREQARRLASRLNEENLRSLWLLIQASLPDDRAWMQAAACLLAGHLNRLEVDLSDLSSELLMEATRFLEDQDAAIAFAKGFFDYDLGISACDLWPQKCTASIFLELAHRLAADKSEERLQMLLKGHGIDESHEAIQDSLAKQLKHQILSRETDDAFEQEGLFLKLALKQGNDLPVNLLLKLSIEERHLDQASADQLMILSEQLCQHDRCVDAAQVAVVAAKAFKSADQVRRSEEAFLRAFNLNHLNREAAQGVAGAVASAHSRCQQLEERCQQLKESSMELQQLKEHCNELEENRKALEKRCQQLEVSHRQLERPADGTGPQGPGGALQGAREEPEGVGRALQEAREAPAACGDVSGLGPAVCGLGLVRLRLLQLQERPGAAQREVPAPGRHQRLDEHLPPQGPSQGALPQGPCQAQKSDEFQLPGGINAWLKLYPKGKCYSSEGMAGLFLRVDKPAVVKWSMQSGSSRARTEERDFSKDLNEDGAPQGWGWPNFMPISEANGCITLRLLSVQLPNSTLSFA